MGSRLNDTDPQSPRALGAADTDPGLGAAPAVLGPKASARPSRPEETPPLSPAVPTPSPGSASIEELLDGITGPRPPPSSKRGVGPDAERAYAAARHAPASRPVQPIEPLVVSPDPPLYSGAGRVPRDLEEEEQQRKADPGSTRPVVQGEKPREERTVYTGRRALVRNLAVAVASSVLVALMMMTIMRWKESQRPRQASAVVVIPAPDMETAAAAIAAPPVPAQQVIVAPSVAAAVATAAAAVATTVPAATTSAPKPAGSVVKRGSGANVKVSAPAAPADSLDDLNRQIRH